MDDIFSRTIPKLTFVFVVFCFFGTTKGLVLKSYISEYGLHGEIEFTLNNNSLLTIRTNLKPTLEYPDQIYRWSIHEHPVDYTNLKDRCSDEQLGEELINFTDELGFLIIPGKENAEFESNNVLIGPKGIWGRSLVLKTAGHNGVICASILSADDVNEKSAEAKFVEPVSGKMIIRWVTDELGNVDSFLQTDIYHSKVVKENNNFTQHKWKLFVTDVIDHEKDNYESNCDVLQFVFNPENTEEGFSVGDLDSKLGLLKIAKEANVKRFKNIYKDEAISMLKEDMEVTTRSLYIVIYDNRHDDNFLACARLRVMEPRAAKVLINMDGISGQVDFTQRSPFDPTWANFQLQASDNNYESNLRFVSSMHSYKIKELPQKLQDADHYDDICNSTGNVYNPLNLDLKAVPPPGLGSQDQYPIGDLLGKYKDRTEYLNHKYLLPGLANELSGLYWDVYLPLYGVHSVIHRSLVLERRDTKRDICGTIALYEHETGYQMAMSSAEVIFRYPIVGRIIFRQPHAKPWEDTTIIFEGLVHADGSNVNNTHEHRWAIHEKAPGPDYYNWSGRCLSAEKVYDPYGVDIDMRHPEQYCKPGLEGMCRIGDLTTRHGMFSIAGRKRDSAQLSRRVFTDSIIALSGMSSIMRKSLVIYDDHGPVARGERMACSIINGLHRRKAVIQDWFGNGEEIQLRGKIEMIQQSPYDVTNVQVTLDGLQDLHKYNIHEVSVEKDLEFPCERTTLYDTYNPFHVPKTHVLPTIGTPDQYELGNLAEKYGLLDGLKSYNAVYNESQISLFGPYSILGRSVVLHKKVKDHHWACSTIERGYSPSEGREIRGIASFHHPGGFAYGYIRLTQLIHSDGSQSETLLEVKLRHPGVNDRNLTRNHGWAIFVNPVGVDAAVKVVNTRCVAGGYVWNPFFTQLADPLNRDLYYQECGADNPLRCDAGDLTPRLGTINIGSKRQLFVDSNLPLEAPNRWNSAMGRSIVIFGPDGSGDKFACANIEPDHDIIKAVNIMKHPRFVLGQFLDEIRRVMGVPPWMLSIDSRKTKNLHSGSCIQLLLHFTGPKANKLELDFTRLLASGRLDSPSIFIPGFVDTKRKKTISYRQCGSIDPNERKKKTYFGSRRSSSSSLSPKSLIMFLIILIHKTVYTIF